MGRRKEGFTVIELLVIAPIVILTIGAFVTVIVAMTGEVLAARSANTTLYNVQDALNRIEQDIKLSSSFLATSGSTSNNNFALTTGQGFDDATSIFQNASVSNGTMLILNSIATTANPIATSSAYVYAIDPLNACGTANVIQNKPQSMNIVYFVKSGTLWRRTIMQSNYNNTSTGWCNSPWQIPSCTPGYTATFCKTQDIQLVTGLGTTGFTVQYFNGASASIENATANNSGTSDANRAAALLSATTASVAITSTQTVAGRTVSQSANMRASRLDINASALVVPTAAATPSTPVVSATTTAPVTAKFSWPQISGASYYTIDYSTNGGTSWTNGFTNQNTTTYSYTGTHNQTVQVRVSATSTDGTNTYTSTYGTASVTIPLWANLVYQNNWADYQTSSWATGAYTKTSAGLVVLKGLIKNGASGTTIGTLPVGYRPAQNLVFASVSQSANARIDILTNGNVLLVAGSVDVSLESIRFMPSGTTFTNVAPPFSNSWANYSDVNYVITPQYNQDSTTRINLQGMIAGGTVTDGTAMFSMPAGLRPTLYAHLPANECGNYGFFAVDQNSGGSVQAKGGTNCWYSLHTIYYPASRTSSGSTCTTQWCALTLQNSWAYYGSPFSRPEYTKGSDGMVSLKGLLNAGSTSGDTIIATLPAGYRPAQRELIPIISNGALGRLDILPDGTLRFEIGSSAWFSLDNILFMAEQ